jgi:BirA family biotin operon repressor/biotin-[acetyl-CoA-carboxylase] ligase
MELSLDKILGFLPQNHPWSNSILCFDTIDSTNTHAKVLAAAGAPHGTVVLSNHQTAGRGRLGRSFHSPSGCGIYLSVILRPNCPPAQLMHLTCAAGCAMCDAVEEAAAIRPGIKWINDLIWDNKKLGGILAELSIHAKTGLVDYAVVGIGINCTQKTEDFPPEIQKIATSLGMITGNPVDRSRLAAAMIRSLSRMSDRLLTDKHTVMNRYRSDCVTLGKEVAVHRFEEIRYGTAVDVDYDGALVVQFADGHREAVSAGEVSVRGMYGYV